MIEFNAINLGHHTGVAHLAPRRDLVSIRKHERAQVVLLSLADFDGLMAGGDPATLPAEPGKDAQGELRGEIGEFVDDA